MHYSKQVVLSIPTICVESKRSIIVSYEWIPADILLLPAVFKKTNKKICIQSEHDYYKLQVFEQMMHQRVSKKNETMCPLCGTQHVVANNIILQYLLEYECMLDSWANSNYKLQTRKVSQDRFKVTTLKFFLYRNIQCGLLWWQSVWYTFSSRNQTNNNQTIVLLKSIFPLTSSRFGFKCWPSMYQLISAGGRDPTLWQTISISCFAEMGWLLPSSLTSKGRTEYKEKTNENLLCANKASPLFYLSIVWTRIGSLNGDRSVELHFYVLFSCKCMGELQCWKVRALTHKNELIITSDTLRLPKLTN